MLPRGGGAYAMGVCVCVFEIGLHIVWGAYAMVCMWDRLHIVCGEPMPWCVCEIRRQRLNIAFLFLYTDFTILTGKYEYESTFYIKTINSWKS